MEKQAFYFGCKSSPGHFLYGPDFRCLYHATPSTFPWAVGHLDAGLLQNRKIPDREDGRVFWTCGGKAVLWFAFVWWDNSVDRRGCSNSGFYVRGFESGEAGKAFGFARETFPAVVERQRYPLVLQHGENR